MASLEMPQQGQKRNESDLNTLIEKRYSTILDQELMSDKLAIELIMYSREAIAKSREQINTLSVNANAYVLNLMAPLLGRIESTLGQIESSVILWENDIQSSMASDSQFRQLMRQYPEKLPLLVERGILQRREQLAIRRYATFPTRRKTLEDFFNSTTACITNIDNFFKKDIPIMPTLDQDIKKKLEQLMIFNPKPDNN